MNNRPLYFDNIEKNNNLDQHSPNRLQWTFFGALKIGIGKAVDIEPIVRIGKTSYLKPEYNRFTREDDQTYPLRSSPFYEIGIRSKFTIGIEKAVFVELARNKQQWEPEGFLNDTPNENFQSEFIIWKLNVGYLFAL